MKRGVGIEMEDKVRKAAMGCEIVVRRWDSDLQEVQDQGG